MFDIGELTIVSGGQTGADRAALDFAIEHNIPHAGWCPRDRLAEDGPLPPHYELCETPSCKYAERTEWNVRDTDATLVFSITANPQGGTRLTLVLAERLGKPVLHLSRDAMSPEAAAEKLQVFLDSHSVRVLNVAGPRASQEPEVVTFVSNVLEQALKA